jgi:NAD(P)-dependent dehydrogenase (short-subunit alcohol dehydrogenase family)
MAESMLGLERKAVLVTGAGQGIGEGVALAFARAGADIAVVDLDGDSASRVADAVRAFGVAAEVVRGDVREAGQAAAMVEAAVGRFGRLDVLVNNVGGLAGFAPQSVLDATTEFWDRIVDVNLRVTFLCSQAAARAMVDAGAGGSIVNVAALGGLRASVGIAPYGAAKAGVVQLTRTLALELGPHGIRVNCVAPGRTETPAMLDTVSPQDRAATAQNVALRRLATPSDVGGVVVALASDLCAYVTGQTIAIDGGLAATMARPPHAVR